MSRETGSFFIICYPGGDHSTLSVAEVCYGMEYELSDYALASNRQIDTKEDAEEYCRDLAKSNGLKVSGLTSNMILDES